MKKIIFVTPKFYPNIGGVETHVLEIARRLVKKYDVWVYTGDLSDKLPSKETYKSIHIRRFRSIHPGNAYYFSLGLYTALKKEKCDILHVHNFNAAPALLAYYAMRNRAKKIIFTPHSHPKGSTQVREFLHRIYDPIQKSLVLGAHTIICVSEYEKTGFVHKYPFSEMKVKVIYNGINIQKARPFTKKEKVILFVGRLEKYKNIQQVIKELPYNPGWKFVIAGDGPYKEALITQAKKLNLNNRITFIGWIDESTKWRWYATSDLVITLSEIEAFGIIVIEGLAMNKPVIIGSAGSFKELKEIYPGKIFDFQPKKGFFDEILEKSGKSKPDLSMFSWDTITHKTMSCYT